MNIDWWLEICRTCQTCIYGLSFLSFPSFIKDSSLIVGDSDLLLSLKGTCLWESLEMSFSDLVEMSDSPVLYKINQGAKKPNTQTGTLTHHYPLYSSVIVPTCLLLQVLISWWLVERPRWFSCCPNNGWKYAEELLYFENFLQEENKTVLTFYSSISAPNISANFWEFKIPPNLVQI